LDLHTCGRYARQSAAAFRQVLALGPAELPVGAFAEVWRRLAEASRGRALMAVPGLMDEPYDLPGGARGWEQAS